MAGPHSPLCFHRRGNDRWWSIHRAILPANSSNTVVIDGVNHRVSTCSSPQLGRATPHRRCDEAKLRFRHIEQFDLVNNEFNELTHFVSPWHTTTMRYNRMGVAGGGVRVEVWRWEGNETTRRHSKALKGVFLNGPRVWKDKNIRFIYHFKSSIIWTIK